MKRSRIFIALMGSVGTVLIMIGASATIASFSDSGKSTIQASAGTFSYTLTNTAGGVTYTDGSLLYGIGAMYPGVPESSQSFIISNTGTSGMKYSIRNVDNYTAPGAEAPILTGDANEKINVKITAGSTVIYNGKVKNSVSGYSPIIPAGESSTITLTLSWPISSNDDLYNGASSMAAYEVYAIAA